MFRKIYKEANDDIKPDSELLCKTLSLLDNEKPKKTLKFSNVYSYGVAVAAVLVICCGIYLYPMLQNINNSDNQVVNPTNKTEISNDKVKSNIINDNTTKEKTSDKKTENTETDKINNNNKSINVNENEKADEKEEVNTDSTVKIEENENKISININNVAILDNSIYGISKTSRGVAQKWDLEKYMQYLDSNNTLTFVIPTDLKKVSGDYNYYTLDENDVLENDKWSFVYENENRRILITTTKRTDTISNLLEEETYKMSNINENTVLIGYNNNEYTAYFINDNVGFSIVGNNISEEELKNLLISIIK